MNFVTKFLLFLRKIKNKLKKIKNQQKDFQFDHKLREKLRVFSGKKKS
jgi:hypothetical protein